MPKKLPKSTISKRKRRVRKQPQRLRSVGLILFGVGVVLYGGVLVHRLVYWETLRVRAQVAITTERDGLVPVKITRLGLFSTAVEPAMKLNETSWTVADTKATYITGSGYVNEPGNMIVYGHNKNEILGQLHRVKVGDQLLILASDGQMYHYRVTNSMAVDPSQTEWLTKSDQKMVTVYTCYGFWDSERWVVRAKLIES